MKESAIHDLVSPVVASCGLEVDRIEIGSAGKRSVLRIHLDGDGPEGRGPSLDEIADATRAISKALDASDATGTRPYVLEVSSRGVSRPLTEERHYRRNLGRLVKITPNEGDTFVGRIAAASEAGVELDVAGAPRTVAYGDVRKAVVQVELNRSDETDGADEFEGPEGPDEEE